MESNTVILNLQEYNALRDFRENLEKNNTHRILSYYETWCGRTDVTVYISSDKAVKDIAEQNHSLEKHINNLVAKIYELEHPTDPIITIEDVKRMSVWKFLRWKRK